MSKQKRLNDRIAALEKELAALKSVRGGLSDIVTVKVPDKFKPEFQKAEQIVGEYFGHIELNPEEGTIQIKDERYLLVRASSLSYDIIRAIRKLYADKGYEEALLIGNNFLFDIAHLIGLEDARNFARKMKLKDPLSRLSAGPVHFAYTGWAFVDILPESRPSPDDDFYLKYHHPFSFEADSWMKNKKRASQPVCIMNSGYSSGWCEESFGIPLTSVEISCKAKGDKHCTFIMAPPHRIEDYLKKEKSQETKNVAIPHFFERQKVEEQLKESLKEKEALLKEIHHRVKNNMQVISSLLNIQSGFVKDNYALEKFRESISRINAMALIHELLYNTKDFSSVNMKEYITELTAQLARSFGSSKNRVKTVIDVDLKSNALDIDRAIPCGLILNEAISNSFKYAFSENKNGIIKIMFKEHRNPRNKYNYTLTIQDNGPGIPGNIKPASTPGLGLELISMLTNQINGKLSISRSKGTLFTIRF